MTIKAFFATLGAMLLVSCSAPIHLYPIRGPLAEQRTIPPIKGVGSGVRSGTISVTLPSGEICVGPWAPVPRESDNRELLTTWDSIYGQGYFVANVVGATWHGRAELHGNLETTILLEFYRGTVKDSPLLGVAKDNRGNIYKVTQ